MTRLVRYIRNHHVYLYILVVFVSSCSLVEQTSKKEFSSDFYSQKVDGSRMQVYVDVQESSLRIYPAKKEFSRWIVDTLGIHQFYQKELGEILPGKVVFNKASLDIDILTMPLKYRPAIATVPSQLNTNLNGAVYIGFRNDSYNVKYITNPLKHSYRKINHYGFSFGLFSGIGSTAMTPTTTDNKIAIEYDGVVWNKGVAGIVAANNFTVGIAVGFDNLMDNNRRLWIYDSQPWFGLAFGLNLN